MPRTGKATRPEPRDRERFDDDPVLARLRGHLDFLGLTRTLDELDEWLAWAVRERPGATVLLQHVLGVEAANKFEQRVARHIDTSGLVERKTLEALYRGQPRFVIAQEQLTLDLRPPLKFQV